VAVAEIALHRQFACEPLTEDYTSVDVSSSLDMSDIAERAGGGKGADSSGEGAVRNPVLVKCAHGCPAWPGDQNSIVDHHGPGYGAGRTEMADCRSDAHAADSGAAAAPGQAVRRRERRCVRIWSMTAGAVVKRDDAHGRAAPRTAQRVHFEDAPPQLRRSGAGCRGR